MLTSVPDIGNMPDDAVMMKTVMLGACPRAHTGSTAQKQTT